MLLCYPKVPTEIENDLKFSRTLQFTLDNDDDPLKKARMDLRAARFGTSQNKMRQKANISINESMYSVRVISSGFSHAILLSLTKLDEFFTFFSKYLVTGLQYFEIFTYLYMKSRFFFSQIKFEQIASLSIFPIKLHCVHCQLKEKH